MSFPRLPVLQFGAAAFSSPAFPTMHFRSSRFFPVSRFQSPTERRNGTIPCQCNLPIGEMRRKKSASFYPRRRATLCYFNTRGVRRRAACEAPRNVVVVATVCVVVVVITGVRSLLCCDSGCRVVCVSVSTIATCEYGLIAADSGGGV